MNLTRTPRVTIGVPAYNAERYLALSLESLVKQTYEDIEILVCDNASTDSTANIVREFANRDRRIRYVRNEENIGAGRNFIRCVELTRSELFRWQAADDLSAPTLVERCVEVLDARPDVIQAYARTILIDENGAELEKYNERIQTLADSPRQRYLHVMRNIGLVNSSFGVMRTNLLRKTAILGAHPGGDIVWQAEMALYGKLYEVPEYLHFRRMHAGAHSAMTFAQRHTFYNPSRSPGRELRMWRQAYERVVSVMRSPLPPGERIRLTASIARDAIASRDTLMAELVGSLRHRWSGVASSA
jgi:glycosyltransferase involved in cell wall biosynthesis